MPLFLSLSLSLPSARLLGPFQPTQPHQPACTALSLPTDGSQQTYLTRLGRKSNGERHDGDCPRTRSDSHALFRSLLSAVLSTLKRQREFSPPFHLLKLSRKAVRQTHNNASTIKRRNFLEIIACMAGFPWKIEKSTRTAWRDRGARKR